MSYQQMQEKGLPDAKRATAGNPSYPYGLCLAIVRTVAGRAGSVILYAEAEGLRRAQVSLRSSRR